MREASPASFNLLGVAGAAEEEARHVAPPGSTVAAEAPGVEPPPETQKCPASAEVSPEVDSEDPVTGLPDRRSAEKAFTRLLIEKRPAFATAIVIDRLAMIEERYGTKLRDEILVYFGQELAQILQPQDQLFRWSSASFVVLLERVGSKAWVRMDHERKFNIRYKHAVTNEGRSALLNVGAVWTMWHFAEVDSTGKLSRMIDDYLRSRGV